VPVTAAVGYYFCGDDISVAAKAGQMQMDGKVLDPASHVYVGFLPKAAGRALPIDMIAGGVSGAVVGYYIAVKTQVHHVLEKARQAAEKAKR
jgi:hypothetical protein